MARNDYGAAVALLEGVETAAVCGHVHPDGDCLGSTLALTAALRAKGIQVTPLLAGEADIRNFLFMEGAEDMVVSKEFQESVDLFVLVDTSDLHRSGDCPAVVERASRVLSIDHHTGDKSFADVSIEDPSYAAVGMMVWEFIQKMGVKPTPSMATSCLTSLMTDTGCFQYQNADAAAFEAAASMVRAGADAPLIANEVYQRRTMANLKLKSIAVDRIRLICGGRAAVSWLGVEDYEKVGASGSDDENAIDVIRQLDGPEVFCLLRDKGCGVRGSFRSKSSFDVAEVARKMNGGGHKAAAGFSPNGKIEDALKQVEELLTEAFEKRDAE